MSNETQVKGDGVLVKRPSPKKKSNKNKTPKVTGLKPAVSTPLPPPEGGSSIQSSLRLSTTSTPMRNDPMYDEIDADDFVGLTEYRHRREFAVTHESFIPLVDREYDLRAATDKRFGAVISKSVYRYVMCIHLYARYAKIRDLRGEAELDEFNLINYLSGKSYSVPPAVDAYLRSIGDFRDESGRHHYLTTNLIWPNENGDFGRVDHNTHWKYASIPSPRILSLMIMKDLEYSSGTDVSRDWQLPSDLVPENVGERKPGLPTVNLLGWSRATALTSDQRAHIEDANITVDSFGGRGRFCLNTVLFEKVHDVLNNSATKVKLGGTMCDRPFGSVGQLLWYQRDPLSSTAFNRTQHYLESEIRGVCCQQLDRRVAMLGQVFSFRARKDRFIVGDSTLDPWSVYDWDGYQHVPPEWAASRNAAFDHGRSEAINVLEFATPYSGRDNVRTTYLRKFLIAR